MDFESDVKFYYAGPSSGCLPCTSMFGLGINGGAFILFIFIFFAVSICIYITSCPTHEEGFTLDALHIRVLVTKCSTAVSLSLAHI